jgi:hypothetical protein
MATVGPAQVGDWNFGFRWAAHGAGCEFDVALDNGTEQTEVVSEAIGGYREGELPAEFFANHPDFIGSITIRVASTCEWAVAVVQFIG